MAKKRKVWKFSAPISADYTILDGNGSTYGKLRIRPSSVLWKPKGAHRFCRVSIEDFDSWIRNTPKATKVEK